MSNNFTINPAHLDAQPEGNSFTFTNPVSPYQFNAKGYQLAAAEGNSFSFSGAKQSGYQYILVNNTASSLVEGCGISTFYSMKVQQSFTEGLGGTDGLLSNPGNFLEPLGVNTFYAATVIQSFTENLGAGDTDSTNPITYGLTNIDNAGLNSFYSATVLLTMYENLGAADPTSKFAFINNHSTVKIQGMLAEYPNYTVKVQGETVLSPRNTVNINGLTQTLVGVTSSGGTYISVPGGVVFSPNSFSPNVMVNSITLIGNPPPAATTAAVYVDIPNSNVPNNNWGDMFSFSMSLDPLGGTWSVISKNPVRSLGVSFNIWGLLATETGDGGGAKNIVNNSAKGYSTRGIFGFPKLNKQLSLTLGFTGSAGTTSYLTLLNQQLGLYTKYSGGSQLITVTPVGGGPTQVPVTNTPTYYSVRETAMFIASRVGITLIWATFDNPLAQSYTIQPTMTALAALQSIVSNVGAALRWQGGNTYLVCPPNYTVGSFIVPAPSLINANGLFFEVLEDLEYGIGGIETPIPFSPNQGIFTIPTPTYSFFNAGFVPNVSTSNNSGGGGGIPPITQVGHIGKLLTVNDPPQVIDLPFDYDQAFIQILVANPNAQQFSGFPEGLGVGTTNPFAGDTAISPAFTFNGSIITDNPNQWWDFAFGSNGFGDTYLGTTLRGNVYTPIAVIDSTFFPTNNPFVAAGNFSLNIGVTRRGLNSGSGAAAQVYPRTVQYVKTYQGTINCVFFGVMPMPGMLASAQVDDILVQGVIESVTFTPPGFLSIQVARYSEINWVVPSNSVGPATSQGQI